MFCQSWAFNFISVALLVCVSCFYLIWNLDSMCQAMWMVALFLFLFSSHFILEDVAFRVHTHTHTQLLHILNCFIFLPNNLLYVTFILYLFLAESPITVFMMVTLPAINVIFYSLFYIYILNFVKFYCVDQSLLFTACNTTSVWLQLNNLALNWLNAASAPCQSPTEPLDWTVVTRLGKKEKKKS